MYNAPDYIAEQELIELSRLYREVQLALMPVVLRPGYDDKKPVAKVGKPR